jgi:hypothetical protein
MREDLVRRDYAESTIRSYLHTIEDFRRYILRNFTFKRLKDGSAPDPGGDITITRRAPPV